MVQPILTSNKAGFTLIELLVSLIITMVGLLGLLAAIDLSIATNMGNEMRLQATGIAEDVLNHAKQQPFANTSSWTKSTRIDGLPINNPPQHYFVRGIEKDYSVSRTITGFTDTKQIVVGVSWLYKNQRLEHTVSTIMGKTYGE